MAFSLQSFRKTLLYQAACTNAQIQAHLKQVASQDQQAEKLSKQYGIWAALSGVAAGLSLFWHRNTAGIVGANAIAASGNGRVDCVVFPSAAAECG